MTVKFAVAQIRVTLNSNINLNSISRMVKKSKRQRASLVLFPEYFISGPKPNKELKKETKLIEKVQNFASSSKIYIVGSHQEIESNMLYNTAFLISNKGKIVAKHRKIYLMPEEIQDRFSAGKEIRVFKTDLGKLALPVCYDSFNRKSPDLMRKFKKQGAEFVLVPKFSILYRPVSPYAVKSWLSAHCFWNRFYILCASSVGHALPIRSFGHSLIICPERGILQEGNEQKEELLIENLDTKLLIKAEKYDKNHG